jgi:hypothetical protein
MRPVALGARGVVASLGRSRVVEIIRQTVVLLSSGQIEEHASRFLVSRVNSSHSNIWTSGRKFRELHCLYEIDQH